MTVTELRERISQEDYIAWQALDNVRGAWRRLLTPKNGAL